MVQTVYGDLFFLINFSMDFLCLFLLSKLFCRRLGIWRAVFASSIGGIYAVIGLLIPEGPFHLALDLLCCFLICTVAFAARGTTLSSLLVTLSGYIATSALLGGIMTAVFSLLNRLSPPREIFGESTDIPLWILIPVGLLSTLASVFCGRWLRTRSARRTATLEVRLDKKRVACTALVDSGHLLREPLSARPVLLLDLDLAPLLLPPGVNLNVPPQSGFLASRLTAIPIQTANGESLLFAIRPDLVLVKTGRQSHAADALIGFSKLGGLPLDCKALIPPETVA